ncbi:MAG: Fe-S cluster assembly ATPase SufC [Actinobacteria bacterium]|nr:Fe-S cluster assembly ATPase SufC [Actinomycetota bacterium]MCL6104418.1 Fe-S cluster assembly ATPase SufC [Actinomycetota bacterium]
MSALLQIEDLHVEVKTVTEPSKSPPAPVMAESTSLLHNINLTLQEGEFHALMGPNGAGKSGLAKTLLGDPTYRIIKGKILFKGEDITSLATDKRAQLGIFLAFQYPTEVTGVPMIQFLRQALSKRKQMDISTLEIRLLMDEWMEKLEFDASPSRSSDLSGSFKPSKHYLNEGLSGGEKKKNEILQMAVLQPELAILDETDSGLDIDALRVVAKGIKLVRSTLPNMTILLITHYRRIFDELLPELIPDKVHIMVDGTLVVSGSADLINQLEEKGYEPWRNLTSVV